MLGYLPQYFGVYENLSAIEFLHYIAAIKGIDRKTAKVDIEKCLDRLNLSEVANQALSTYSGGMRQRVGIAQALLNSPKIVIFDEPTVGLDPDERSRFRDILVEISDSSIVLLSTHIVSDVESIADQIAIMQSGKLVAHGDCQRLLSQVENKVWQCQIEPNEMTLFKSKFQVTYSIRRNDKMQVRVLSETAPTANAKLESPSLEDAFAFYASSRS
jgi:ABC-2 type transport system ATP-binding protein